MKNLNAYHNAFYAKTSDDLKYKKDRFVIGCHKIPRAELESLREIYRAAKAKHDAVAA